MKGFKKNNIFHPIKSYRKLERKNNVIGIRLSRYKRDEKSNIKEISKDTIIEVNKEVLIDPRIVDLKNIEPFAVRDDINEVIDIVSKTGNTDNREENIIQKATYLMASISWLQPFVGGNKRTSYVSAKDFLRDNGYSFTINTEKDRDELITLLYKIQETRSELDTEILQEISFYIRKRIKKHD